VIDQHDRRVIEWIQSVVPSAPVSLDLAASDLPSGVNVYLLELGASPPPRGSERSPVQFSLHYLITSWAQDAFEAHKILGDLVSAAMQEAEFEVNFDVSHVNWNLFGLAPRPAFLLKVSARIPLPETSAPLVRKPIVLKTETITSLTGRVLGPGDIPIVGAHVQLSAFDLSVRTDANGRFVLPIGTQPPSLRVTVKGKSQSVSAEPPPDGTPLTIWVDPAEV
jgi:hypothetical protein